MTLHVTARVERPNGFTVDANITISTGEVVAILGPNGAGKTTILRAIAGLVPITRGRIALDDRVWDEPPATLVPPERRTCGVVFQDYLLFDHMSVVENVAFGPRSRGARKRDAVVAARALLHDVGLADRAQERPRAQSRGQAQRVALARALATGPDVLLLDEPLSALDAGTRMAVRAGLRRRLHTFTGRTLLVTHDPIDALTLADRIIVIENGRIVQEGQPNDITSRPGTEYVARLVGLNLLHGIGDGICVRLAPGLALPIANANGSVRLVVPPGAVTVSRESSTGSWPVIVTSMEHHANVVRLHLDGDAAIMADLGTGDIAALAPEPDERLWARIDLASVNVLS